MKSFIYGIIGLVIIISVITKIGSAISQSIKSDGPDELAAWVKQSLSTEIKKDTDYNGITVGEVALIKESSKKYTGYVEFVSGSNSEKASLSVTVDDSSKLYKCDPPRSLIVRQKLSHQQSENEHGL